MVINVSVQYNGGFLPGFTVDPSAYFCMVGSMAILYHKCSLNYILQKVSSVLSCLVALHCG